MSNRNLASTLAMAMILAVATGAVRFGEGDATTTIPKSVQLERHEIHSALEEATRAPGRVGVAATALAKVLHPHFVREEEIALPPLGALAPLAAGVTPVQTAEILVMVDALKQELPRMLEEHKQIRAAVDSLRAAAHAEGSTRYEQLADQLALHAQTEEEVLYPAVVLVGEIIRTRRAR
jgi:iron-sulfur cluster repair protein YtfE (RIC family)